MKRLLIMLQVASALVPKKLYTMKVETQVDGVKMINGHLALFGPHYIGIIDNVKLKYMAPKRMKPRELLNSIPAPTNVGRVPKGVLKQEGQWWITTANVNDTSGHIYLAQPNPKGTTYHGISGGEGYTYESIKFSDMNKDKRIDIVAARYMDGVGELLWLQQPYEKDGGWNIRKIHEGMADANFALLDKRGKKYVIVAGRKFSSIGVIWTLEQKGKWMNKEKVRHRVADNYGAYNDIQMVDLNNDGRVDILTSVIKRGASRGHVISYQLPDDFVFGQWKRTVLAGGFDQEGSPGRAEAFWPDPKLRGKTRPHVFVNGAGDGGSYILVPAGNKGLAFRKMAATPSYGRVGLTFIGDLSGDGKPELIIPQEDKIHVYTYGIKSGNSQFRGYDPMEKVDNPKIALIPETRFKSNKPTPKTPMRRQMMGGPMGQPMMMGPMGQPMMMGPMGQPMMGPMNPAFQQMVAQFAAQYGVDPQVAMNQMAQYGFGQSNNPASAMLLNGQPNVHLKNGLAVNATLDLEPKPSSPEIQVFDLVARSASGTPPGTPVSKQDANNASAILPGSNTVVEEFDEFKHPMFELTTGAYDNQHLIKNECHAMGRVLCNIKQVLTGINMGPTGLDETWLWYDTEGRGDELVKTKKCEPAEVLWPGYKCVNGIAETSKVKSQVLAQGLCCGVLHGATMTDSVFPHKLLAEAGCGRQDRRLCRAHELLGIWAKSTLKTPGWGWVYENKLAKLTEKCDPEAELWAGYTCYASKIEITAPTNKVTTAPAYCCDRDGDSSSTVKQASLILLLSSVFALMW